MTGMNDRSQDAAELRRRAEASAQDPAVAAPENPAGLPPEETLRVLHELRVHQIELEMQNEELRRAQAELEASRTRYFDLYDQAPVGYVTLSEEGVILEANLTAAHLLGVDRDDLVAKLFTRFIFREDQDRFYLLRKQFLETDAPRACELRLVKPEGEPFWVQGRGTAMWDAAGELVFRVVLSDITERQRAEAELQEIAHKISGILEHMEEAFFTLDDQLVVTSFNAAAEKALGRNRREVLGRPLFDVFPEARGSIFEDYYRRGIQEKKPLAFETFFGVASYENWYEVRISPQPQGISVFFQVITERKRAEAEIASLARFPQENPNPVLRVSPAGVMLYQNPSAGVLVAAWRASGGDPLPAEIKTLIAHSLEADVEITHETTLLGQTWILSLTPVVEEGYVNIYGRDITERKQAEEQLRSAYLRLEAVAEVTSLGEADTKTVCDHILATITKMTESQYGFYGFINADESVMTIHTWSGEAMKDCTMADKPVCFSIDQAGVWGEAIRRREPLILNDYAGAHPGKKGLPAGHVALTRLLVVPFFTHDRITAVAAVANRARAYEPADVTHVTAFLNAIQAFTESLQSRIELRESEGRQRAILDTIPAPAWLKDREGRFLAVNQAWQRFFGLEAEVVVGKTAAAFLPPEVAGPLQAQDDQVVHTGETLRMEERLSGAHGEPRWFETVKAPIQDAQGIAGTVGLAADITERKRVEETLRENQALLRQMAEVSEQERRQLDVILSHLSQSVMLLDGQGQILWLNPEALRLHGFASQEKMLTRLSEYMDLFAASYLDGRPLPTEDWPTARALRGEMVTDCVIKVLRCDTDQEYIGSYNAVPIRDAAGRVVQVVVTIQDITESKRAEAALRESEYRFYQLYEKMGSGVAVYEARDEGNDFVFKDINLAGQRLSHVTREECVGRSVLEKFPAIKAMGLFAVLQRVWRTGVAEHHPMTAYQDARITQWVENDVYKLPTGEIVAVYEDVTACKQAEEELSKFKTITDNANYGAAITDLQGRVLYVNLTWAQMHGATPEALVGQHLSVFHTPAQMERVNALWEVVMRQGSFNLEEVGHVRNDGTVFPALMSASLVRDEQGRPRFFSATATDISELKRVQDQLRRHHEELAHVSRLGVMGEMMTAIAHEINQPLCALTSFSEACLEKLVDNEHVPAELKDHLKTIAEQAIRAGRVITEIRQLAQKRPPQKTAEYLHEVIGEVLALMAAEAHENEVQVEYLPDQTLGPVLMDRILMQQVLMNLVKNAIEAIAEGGGAIRQVTVTTRKEEGQVEVAVGDTGQGLAPENFGAIFESFYTTKPQGIGMGLTLSRRIVTDAGGELWVTPNADRGVTFRFTLPL